jgi:hypothetical protein
VNPGQRGTTGLIVDDLLHNTLDKTITLGEIVGTKLRHTLAASGMRLKDAPCTLTLCSEGNSHYNIIKITLTLAPNNTTHLVSA